MKVVAILEDDIAVGGGFNQAVNAILQMRRICEGRFDFEVFAGRDSGASHLRILGIEAMPFSLRWPDRLLLRLSASPRWRYWQRRLRLLSSLERRLIERGCDLVYFVRQSELCGVLQRLNFVATLFDMCHRDTPEFPEVREFNEFLARERFMRTHLAGAILILADSPALASAAVRRYGLDAQRLLAMPFAPAALLDKREANDKQAVLAKYGLHEGYLFYPAQFWAHKNHVRILEALAILAERGQRPSVVFCGGDMGNLRHVERLAGKLGVREQVRSLGFVPAQDMRGLYEGCAAVVMPTYFGPTNLPALEAWKIGKPLVYSQRCIEQAGNAALCVDPDDAQDLAQAMRRCLEPDTAADLVRRGTMRLRQIDEERTAAEAELLRRLQQFDARRRCWE
jgi:glycosyltransferase involved in cell wall biosynthesis